MSMNEKTRLTVNRIVAVLAGGLLVFAVMSLTVVNSANNQIEELSQALDTSRHEAGRLLSDAEEHFAAGNYVQATASLETLFQHQPGSAEATRGRELLATLREAESDADARWEAALPQIRTQWTASFVSDLRADFEEKMDTVTEEEWTKVRSDVRESWEQEQEG